LLLFLCALTQRRTSLDDGAFRVYFGWSCKCAPLQRSPLILFAKAARTGFAQAWHDRDPRILALVAKAQEWGVAGPHLALTESISPELQLPANINGAISSTLGWRAVWTSIFHHLARWPRRHAEETTHDRACVINIKDVAVRLVLFVVSFPTPAAS
jgi:hypothetical protein